jgi:hypothetical protein
MAVAVLTNVPSTITLAESITGWSGDTFNLDPDIKVQGSNSVSCAMTTNGANNIQYATSFAATNQHIRIWINLTFVSNIDIEANGGIQIEVVSGAGTALYTVGGNDTYAGGWKQFVIYTGNTPTTGSVPSGTCTAVGLTVNTTSKPRNVPANCYCDAWYYGDGYSVTGGTSGDEIDWSHIAALDAIEAYGIVTRLDDVYFLAGDVSIGVTATTTFFKSGQKVQFKDLAVSATLYGITFSGTACNIDISGGAIGAAGIQNYLFDASDTGINSFTLTGVQFAKANSVLFAAGESITNSVFDNCGQVVASTSTFSGNTFANSVDTGGALLWPTNDSNISGLSFINNNNGVEYDATSDSTTPTFNNLTFDDVGGKFDVNNTSGGAITIVISNGGNANSYTGSLVTFSNPKSFKFTLSPSIINYEWRIYTVTALGSLAGAVEIDGEELATVDNQTYNYNYSVDQPIGVQIISKANDYIEEISYFTLKNSNQDIGITLTKDNNN